MSSTAAASDPFHAILNALETEVGQLRVKFDSWRAALQATNTATDLAFQRQHTDFSRDLTKTEELCRKVKSALANISANRTKFPHIDDRELASRYSAIERLDKVLMGMHEVYFSRETAGKIQADQKRLLQQRAADEVNAAAGVGGSSGAVNRREGPNAYNMANSDYLKDQSQQQATIRRDQDQTLDKMGNALDRLNEMAVTIDTELREQDKILEDIDNEIDVAQGKMDQAIKQVEKLLKTKDKCQLATIAGLVITFIIVAVIAFYVVTN